MECNKDEAIRAKEIAEKKFKERNYTGAKKFASKALNLYPSLEGISQILTICDVYISGENKINEEADWYGILGVSPSADDETVRKQYRKLALLLHPDKNKCLGADGAFKLVSEAWSLLSDKAKRLAYDQRRNSKGVQQKVPSWTGGPSVPPTANGFHSFTTNSNSYARAQNKHVRVSPPPPPSHLKTDTFWTICSRCKTHYEYLRIYLNHTLLCPNCHEAFFALEKAPPPNVFKSSNWSRSQDQTSRQKASAFSSTDHSNFQWGPFSKTSGVGGTVPHSTAAEAASVVQQASEKVKREMEAQEPTKKRRIGDFRINGYVGGMSNPIGMGRGAAGTGSASGSGICGFPGSYNKPNSQRELPFLEVRNMLIKKAHTEIHRKLKEWSEIKSLEKEKLKEKGSGKQNSMINGGKIALKSKSESNLGSQGPQRCKSFSGASDDETDKETAEPKSINVPDPDFHNFDSDRTEGSFKGDQIWAAYDDDDGMPRFYARIHKVISLDPCKMQISWLNSRSNSELGPIDWVGSGFTKTCGEFRLGRHEITQTINYFSHKVNWTKGTRGVIRIYPRKGDVWALYSNWSPDWTEHTPDEVIHKYDMVEVLADYDEEGVSITPLVKVSGFRTVFCKNVDPKELKRIPKEEMFRFSHQVPTYLLTGQEAQNAPEGCFELDPAATPVELLQVITEANELSVLENGERKEARIRGRADNF